MSLLNKLPTYFTDLVLEAMPFKNVLLNQGVVEVDSNSVIQEGSRTLNIRNITNLEATTTVQRNDGSTDITPSALTDYEEVGAVVNLMDGIKTTDLERLLTGENGVEIAASQVAGRVLRNMQSYFVSALKGQFAEDGPLASSHVITADGDGLLDIGTALSAKQSVLGEAQELANTMIVNSKQWVDIVNFGITYVPALEFTNGLITDGNIPTFGNMRVLVNDSLCAQESDDRYPVYMVNSQPWKLVWQRELSLEDWRNPITDGGTDYLLWRFDFVPHVKGMDYQYSTAGANPTTTTMETGTSWAKARSGASAAHFPYVKLKVL